MTLDLSRVRAVIRKELREYRRTSFVVWTMVVLVAVYAIIPLVIVLTISATAPSSTVKSLVGTALLLLLIIPAFAPVVIAAYSVVGERDQGTLEPLLTTPIRRTELLLGKGLAALLPTLAVTYALQAIFYITVLVGASSVVASAVFRAPLVLAEVLYAPLLAGWGVWIGIAISVRSSDVRIAQQLTTFASLPVIGLTTLISFQVIRPTVLTAIAFGVGLLLIDLGAWRIAARMFDRERLVSGQPTKRRTAMIEG
jgi:ABC-2 type transport system permease protein